MAPKPVVAAPAAAAAPKKCDFSATLKDDQTFAFGKATLNAAAMAQLDKEVLAKLSNCAEVKLILVTGHTDRIGSQQGNQKLSEKRADSVKAYLAKKGVKANIETMGAGKTQAVPGVTCDDKLPKKKLIDCLAPNRRTVVEVQGPAK
jgi:OOP family OmpA-OmpF porin